MRSLSTLKNMIMSLAYEIMLILFGLIVPRLIIETYGSEVNGLTSTITHILTILNLLQAGAVGASIFQMFKPVAEKDYLQVSRIIDSSKRYFRKIGIIFLLLVVVVAPFMAMGTESSLEIWEKAMAFIILGVNGAFYFFFTSWFDILFSSHQKRFILSVAGIVDKLLYYGLLFVVIFSRLHFMWMYVAVLAGTCARVLFLYAIYNKQFKPLLVKVDPDPSFKIQNKGYLLCNQIASQAVDGLPTVMITSVAGLASASVYAVYNLVQNMIKMVVRTVQLSVSEVFGNLVVSENEEKVRRVYDLMEFVFFLAATVLCCCAGFLFMPFIYLYTDCNTLDVSYIYPILAMIIVAYDVVYCMYMPCYTLTNVYGLFKETYLQAVVCSVIAIVGSLACGFIYWPLVMLGPVFYYLSSLVFRLIVAKRRVPWLKLTSFIRRMAMVLLSVVLSVVLSTAVYANGYPANWWHWILHGILCGMAVLSVVGVYSLMFERNSMKGVFRYAKQLVMKKLGRKKASDAK